MLRPAVKIHVDTSLSNFLEMFYLVSKQSYGQPFHNLGHCFCSILVYRIFLMTLVWLCGSLILNLCQGNLFLYSILVLCQDSPTGCIGVFVISVN